MQYITQINRPSKDDQRTALESYDALIASIDQIDKSRPEIHIKETDEKIVLPFKVLELIAQILKSMSEGKPISIVPIAAEMTTQMAAEILGCSRPHLVKLLEKGEIEFTKVGRHRRIKVEDVLEYKKKRKNERKSLLIEIMEGDEELGLYDL